VPHLSTLRLRDLFLNTGPTTESKKITPGGKLTYFFQGAPPLTFDPAFADGNARGSSAASYLGAIYGLLVYEDWTTDKGKVVPQMAKSLTAIDPSNWVLKLREGICFTDGTLFDAAVVKFNWERIASMPKAWSQSAAAQIASLTVVNPLTLHITLKAPNSSFD
jgi:peptide/nickel transport system substrate-binding protein